MNRNLLTLLLALLLLGRTTSVLAQAPPPDAPPPATVEAPTVSAVPFTPLEPLPDGQDILTIAAAIGQTGANNESLAAARVSLDDAAKEMQTFRIFSDVSLPKTPISLKVRDSKITDALKNALEQAKLNYVLDADIPDDPKVTLDIQNVRIEAVLDLLTENAGVSWTSESKGGKKIVHVGKTVKRFSGFDGLTETLGGTGRLFVPRESMNNPFVYSYHTQETRSTFTCSNCHNQITIVKKNVAAKCPTCGRTFQSDWKVCPFDGTARPVAQDTWKFCPICAFPIPATAMAPVTQNVPVTSVTITSKEAQTAPPAPATAPVTKP